MDKENGYRFDPSIPLLDPYAKLISGREIWGEDADSRRPLRCRVILEDYAWEGDKPLEIPISDLIIYELHVRGFTIDQDSEADHKGTFTGVVEMIPYLKDLGVNCVELLPVFEFDELENTRIVNGKRLYNYWGYSTFGFFAPKSAYAVSGKHALAADEMKHMVFAGAATIRTLTGAGIPSFPSMANEHGSLTCGSRFLHSASCTPSLLRISALRMTASYTAP